MPDALPEASLKGFVSPLGIELINASCAGLVCEIYSFYMIKTLCLCNCIYFIYQNLFSSVHYLLHSDAHFKYLSQKFDK